MAETVRKEGEFHDSEDYGEEVKVNHLDDTENYDIPEDENDDEEGRESEEEFDESMKESECLI